MNEWVNDLIGDTIDIEDTWISDLLTSDTKSTSLGDEWISDLLGSDTKSTQTKQTQQSTDNTATIPTEQFSPSSQDTITGLTRTQRKEGFVGHVYKDSEGNDTIGYGHKLTEEDKRSGRFSKGLSREEAQNLYQRDEQLHTAGLYKRNPWVSRQPLKVQEVLKDMAYNMGSGFLEGWQSLKIALKQGDYKTASAKIKSSKYARQTKGRAIENANILASL